jgi:hypothetical protein
MVSYSNRQEDLKMWAILIPSIAVLVAVMSALWGMQNLVDCPFDK